MNALKIAFFSMGLHLARSPKKDMQTKVAWLDVITGTDTPRARVLNHFLGRDTVEELVGGKEIIKDMRDALHVKEDVYGYNQNQQGQQQPNQHSSTLNTVAEASKPYANNYGVDYEVPDTDEETNVYRNMVREAPGAAITSALAKDFIPGYKNPYAQAQQSHAPNVEDYEEKEAVYHGHSRIPRPAGGSGNPGTSAPRIMPGINASTDMTPYTHPEAQAMEYPPQGQPFSGSVVSQRHPKDVEVKNYDPEYRSSIQTQDAKLRNEHEWIGM